MLNHWILLLGAFGICIAFVITWILKSETSRIKTEQEWEKLKNEFERIETQKALLEDRLEDSVNVMKEMEESDTYGHSQTDESTQETIREMTEHLREIEEENQKLRSELSEASDSLEEIYKAVYEDGTKV